MPKDRPHRAKPWRPIATRFPPGRDDWASWAARLFTLPSVRESFFVLVCLSSVGLVLLVPVEAIGGGVVIPTVFSLLGVDAIGEFIV